MKLLGILSFREEFYHSDALVPFNRRLYPGDASPHGKGISTRRYRDQDPFGTGGWCEGDDIIYLKKRRP